MAVRPDEKQLSRSFDGFCLNLSEEKESIANRRPEQLLQRCFFEQDFRATGFEIGVVSTLLWNAICPRKRQC